MKSLLVVVLFLMLIPSASAIQPGPATIRVTTRQIQVVRRGDTVSRLYNIYNRPAYRNAIGNAVLRCSVIGRYQSCRADFLLSRGEIVMQGTIRSLAFYRLAVVGGTGYYDNIGGSSVIQQIGSDAYSIVINIQGF
jgi:hypothetical protein